MGCPTRCSLTLRCRTDRYRTYVLRKKTLPSGDALNQTLVAQGINVALATVRSCDGRYGVPS
jgi:hypothetical protein